MTTDEKALKLHADLKGKLSTEAKYHVKTREDLSLAYTPGVAKPCVEIANNPEDVYKYTWKGNTVAVVSDGSAVLGLGNIGAKAAMPVMEGKAVLFKEFGNVTHRQIFSNLLPGKFAAGALTYNKLRKPPFTHTV